MRRKLLLCLTIVLAAMLCITGMPVSAAAAKKPAAKPVVIPAVQAQYANMLIQLEIMPKVAKSTPKLSDKIRYEDFTLYTNNAMSIETPKVPARAKNAKARYLTLAEAEAILLKALGYGEEIGKDLQQAHIKAVELGLNAELKTSAEKQITCGEAAVLIYNSLTVPFSDAETAAD